MVKAQAAATVVVAAAVVATVNAPTAVAMVAEMAGVMGVASVAATAAAVLHVTTIAMVNSNPHVRKAHAHHRAKAVVVDLEWVSSSPQVLRMSHVLPAHQPDSQTQCAPAWI